VPGGLVLFLAYHFGSLNKSNWLGCQIYANPQPYWMMNVFILQFSPLADKFPLPSVGKSLSAFA
jgi:hypothetical protein